ncbi:MAG TPA: molybdate ABC transporter permease subunit [Abditibacteriaceae bacterium]|jgi:molybdate transport system permease protein
MQNTPFSWHPVWLSLQVASAAWLLVFIGATWAAHFVARRTFRGKALLDALLTLPLVLPPVVVGYALLLLLGKNGFIGALLEPLGVRLLFTPAAAVLAAATVAFPLMYGTAKATFEAVDTHSLDAALSLGATPARTFWTVSLPLARGGLIAGSVLSFARALGEFGATIMVAGNIEELTTTMPTAIYSAAESGDLRLAGIFCALLAALNLLFVLGLSFWKRNQ